MLGVTTEPFETEDPTQTTDQTQVQAITQATRSPWKMVVGGVLLLGALGAILAASWSRS